MSSAWDIKSVFNSNGVEGQNSDDTMLVETFVMDFIERPLAAEMTYYTFLGWN